MQILITQSQLSDLAPTTLAQLGVSPSRLVNKNVIALAPVGGNILFFLSVTISLTYQMHPSHVSVGLDCSTIPTCYRVSNCSRNGLCIDFDVCMCDQGWNDTTCTQYSCEKLNYCSGVIIRYKEDLGQ